MLLRIGHLPRLTLAFLVVLAMTEAVFAQAVQETNPPQPVPAPGAQLAPSGPAANPQPTAPAAPPAPEKRQTSPGLVDQFNRLLKNSAEGLSSTFQWTMKGSQQTLEDLNARTKSATEGLTKLQAVVDGRMMCPISGNGAPDCEAASLKLCRSKGYKDGKSLDIETAEKCSARVYISGRTGKPGECRTENYVTRAMCQ